MKKLFIITSLLTLTLISCSKDEAIEETIEIRETRVVEYTEEEQYYINAIYDFCITFYEVPASIIDDKIETIRWCDLQDTSGDIFPELDGYLEIKHIIWPNGYAKPI